VDVPPPAGLISSGVGGDDKVEKHEPDQGKGVEGYVLIAFMNNETIVRGCAREIDSRAMTGFKTLPTIETYLGQFYGTYMGCRFALAGEQYRQTNLITDILHAESFFEAQPDGFKTFYPK